CSDTSSSSRSAQTPWAVASRSLSSRTRWAGMAEASPRSSTTQGRFTATTRPSITGPAMPTQAAAMSARGPSPRKRAMAASSEGKSWLCNVASRTTMGAPARGSNSARVVLVPPTSPARITLLLRARVESHHGAEELQRVGLLALKRVTPDDRPEPTAIADGADLIEHLVVLRGGATGEDDDAPAVERRLHHVAHTLGQRPDRHLRGLVDVLRRGLLEVGRGQLDLDDVRTKLGGDVRGIGGDVRRRLAILAEAGAARIGPDDDGKAARLGFLGDRADLLVHRQPMLGARIDREADGHAAQAQRVAHRAGDGLVGILLFEEDVVIVELEDERHTARELAGARLQEAERRRVRVAAGLDGELEVVARIVRRRVDREAARRAVLDALVHRQDHELARAGQRAGGEQTREVRQRAGTVAAVPGQDLFYSLAHKGPPREPSIPREPVLTHPSAA